MVQIQAGVQLPINVLHRRQFFDSGLQRLVSHRVQAGVLNRHRSLVGKCRQESQVCLGKDGLLDPIIQV